MPFLGHKLLHKHIGGKFVAHAADVIHHRPVGAFDLFGVSFATELGYTNLLTAIDLAGIPYGVDLRTAWRMGVRAWREPGLPGRYCPHSAARAILNAMDRLTGEEGAR